MHKVIKGSYRRIALPCMQPDETEVHLELLPEAIRLKFFGEPGLCNLNKKADVPVEHVLRCRYQQQSASRVGNDSDPDIRAYPHTSVTV